MIAAGITFVFGVLVTGTRISSAKEGPAPNTVVALARPEDKPKKNDDKNGADRKNDDKKAGEDKNDGNKKNKLNTIGTTCADDSKLRPHDGFQKGNRCVSTEMGEVGAAAKNPTLLIVDSPEKVRPQQAFNLKVSTRNLVRDRFLAAAQGGYYAEMSKLNAQGLVRGHFHTACRMLDSDDTAPDPDPVPAFFVATEDGGGGASPDVVTIRVPGLPKRGVAQCASWAGDGSHRMPLMERANEVPAFDSVRVRVE